MNDVLMITVVGGFFALATAYVRLCDRVIGPDPVETPQEHLDSENVSEVASDVRVSH